MRNVSNAFKQALVDDQRDYKEYADFTLEDNTILHLTNEHFWQGGFSYEDSVTSGDKFQVGSAVVNKVNLTLNNIYGDFDDYDFFGATAIIGVGLEINGVVERVNFGQFTVVEQPVYNGSLISIELYDNMFKFDQPYNDSSLVYPASLDTIIRDACTRCGVILSTTNFPNKNFVVQTRPEDENITFREVIAYAAQIAGCYARIEYSAEGHDGRLALRWFGSFSQNASNIHDIDSIYTHRVSTDDVVITGVKVSMDVEHERTVTESGVTHTETVYEKAEYLDGTDGYVLSIENNPLIAETQVQTVAEYLGNRLIGYAFRKASVTHGSDPSIEAGDIAVLTNGKGETFNILISKTKFSVGAAQNTESVAEEPVRNSSARYTAETQNYVKVRKRIAQEKTQRQLIEAEIDHRIDTAQGLYETQVQQQGGGVITYLHNKPDLEESDIQIMVSSVGVMVTANGTASQPTWYGLTVDGTLLANILSVSGIHADWINTGQLVITKDGQEVFFADVDTGTVRISGNSVRITPGDAVSNASASIARGIMNSVGAYGLCIKVNYSSFTNSLNGCCYYHGFNEQGERADVDGWVAWLDNETVTIPKGVHIHPGNKLPNDTLIYSVYRKTTEKFNDIFWNDANARWEGITYTGSVSGDVAEWTWEETNDIVLASYKMPISDNSIYSTQIYTPPLRYSELPQKIINDVEEQVDGLAVSWYYDYEPTLSNYPASEWTTEKLKDEHLGDTFYDTSTGYAYKFIKNDSDNLLPYIFTGDGEITRYGVTVNNYVDSMTKQNSYITLDGTCTTTWQYKLYADYMVSLSPGTYKVVQPDIDGTCLYVVGCNVYGETVKTYVDSTSKTSFTIGEDDNIQFVSLRVRIDTGYTFDSSTDDYTPVLTGSVYQWLPISDPAVAEAMRIASQAQDTADGKRRTFISTPYPPYDVGDIWMVGTSGDILVCITARPASGSYYSSDWAKRNKYTDDTVANAANARATAKYGTCGTGASTVAKAVALSNFVLYTGARITVRFTYANTASSPTLNVNNTGAKAIWAKNAVLAEQYYWTAGSEIDFTYDGTHWVMANAKTAEEVFLELTNNETLKGIFMENNKLYINMDYLRTGTCKIGGSNNGNGVLEIYNSSGTRVGRWDNGAMYIGNVASSLTNPNTKINTNGAITTKSLTADDYIKVDGNSNSSIKIPYETSNYSSFDDSGFTGYTSANTFYTHIGRVLNSNNTWLQCPVGVFNAKYANNATYHSLLDYRNLHIYDGNTVRVWLSDASAYFGTTSGVNIVNSLTVGGRLDVSGVKNRVATTDDYGQRCLSAYETASPMFGDIGDGVISNDGKCYVQIDGIFAETVSLNQYQVFLQKYGDGDCYVSERKGAYFVVEGTPGLSFGWELKAKQADFTQYRLEKKMGDMDTENQADYIIDLANHIEEIQREREVAV